MSNSSGFSRTDDRPSTSSSLIQRVKQHDPDGWSRLVDLYGPLIYYWCRRSDLPPEDAADVAQDVFRSVHSGIETYRHEGPQATFRGWLWTITRNKLNDHFRRKQSRVDGQGGTDAHRQLLQVSADEPTTSKTSSAVRRVLQRALDQIRGDFTEKTWQSFSRCVFDSRSSAEVARELKISPNAVRKAKARVLRRLREELGDSL